jgi:hypothetical protein
MGIGRGDMTLAHAVRDPNSRANNGITNIEERGKMMQMWSDYLDGLKAGVKILPFLNAAGCPFQDRDLLS